MKIYGNSDIGLVRHANEDSFRCESFSENTALLVVCDGMGGANGGSMASRMAVDTRIYCAFRRAARKYGFRWYKEASSAGCGGG